MTGSQCIRLFLWLILLTFSMVACKQKALNSPHQDKQAGENIYFSVFTEQPKTLDPAKSYSANENIFTAQIYEPPLQYHYLLRPYQLIPLTAVSLPQPKFYDKHGHLLGQDAGENEVAYSVYDITIKPGIRYQPHPALAKTKLGYYFYQKITPAMLKGIDTLSNFKHTGSRELKAADYVYEIKRLASPKVQSPIFGFISDYIVGMKAYNKKLQEALKQQPQGFLDLRQYPLAGVKALGPYRYQVTIKGKYPQFAYWLAMPFFAPVPWEADRFYSQPGMRQKNLTFDWYPIGTGPYMMTENNPNRRIVLQRNPNFRQENFPTEGMPEDMVTGILEDAGKPLPFIDQFIFTLEKESIPHWNKFLQGYYDKSGISSDSYDQAIQVDASGKPDVTAEFQNKGIRLTTSIEPSIFYLGFNMIDPVVGGYSERARKLRQAISIALNMEDYISIFLNGRGVPAQGPIPPGIFGYREGQGGINPYVYQWKDGHAQRYPLSYAKKLLAQAGYPNGRDAKTGKPLVLNYEAMAAGSPDQRAVLDWMRKQFAKLGIQLHVRATNYNRFQEKIRTGNAQLFFWGWSADYPDPENFLFLLYGPNNKVNHGGENATNYNNPQFDELFRKMKSMPNGPERQAVIDQMLAIVRKDAPWLWGFHPKTFVLAHRWNRVNKSHPLANNTLKYARINPGLRQQLQREWNQPIYWPLWVVLGVLVVALVPVILRYWKKQHRPPEQY